MPFHAYNHGIVTSGKGVVRECFNFAVGATGAPGTILQSSANLVNSITRVSAGLYTIQLNLPYPPRLVGCFPIVAVASGAVPLAVSPVRGSYSATAGTFQIVVSETDGTPAAVDPANGDFIMVDLVFDRYTKVT